MLEKDLIGTWVCYKISNGEREQVKKEGNTSQWTFQEDGSLVYQFAQNNGAQGDGINRFWKLNYKEEGPIILINNTETYRIISLENEVLILESIKGEGMRHYYAKSGKYNMSADIQQLP